MTAEEHQDGAEEGLEALARATGQRVLDGARRWWDWLVVATLGVYMFVVRMRPFEQFNTDKRVLFTGTDPYYHARQILYTVENFPSTLGFDALTRYPFGTAPGQFGTLFDQVAALLAWAWSLATTGGAPTEALVLDVVTAYPALLGALTVVPVYLVARELAGRGPALVSALVLALFTGSFLFRGLAAVSDHHMMEAVLSTLAVWAAYRAVKAWDETGISMDEIVAEPATLLDGAYRHAAATALFAGVAFWAYLAAWSPGVLFVGIVGAWILLDTLLDGSRGRDPAPIVVAGVITFTTLAILMLPYALTSPVGGFSALNYTWMQPTIAILVALGIAGLAGLSVLWARQGWPAWTLPAGGAGAGLVGFGALQLLFPKLIDNVLSGASWVTGIGVQRTRLTISEAQALDLAQVTGDFGIFFALAVAGFLLVTISAIRGQRRGDLLLLVWAILATRAAFTQSRFLYYLAIVVAVLNAELVAKLYNGLTWLANQEPGDGRGSSSKRSRRSDAGDAQATPTWVAVSVAAAVLLTLIPANVTGDGCGEGASAWSVAGCSFPRDEALWHRELVWMREHTPPIPYDLSSGFQPPAKGEAYPYEEGTYGILSWWDYGHQTELDARRPPIANPFQQNAPLASIIFTAPNETAALAHLDAYLGEGNDARYLLIDDAMVSTKFAAITIWAEEHGPWGRTFKTYQDGQPLAVNISGEGITRDLPSPGDRIHSMFLQSVYHDDGSGMSHFRLVRESPRFSFIGSELTINQQGAGLTAYHRILSRMSADAARDQMAQATPPGLDPLNFQTGQSTLIVGSGRHWYDLDLESSLKTFERVDGATLTGTADPGSLVRVAVSLEANNTGRTFTYRNQVEAGPDGSFALVVPYSTTDLVPLEEGGTDLSVRATGPYQVDAGGQRTTVHVPDRAVLEGQPVQVQFG